MDKYEERVSKILEKKEVYDKAKKQKKKIIIQSTREEGNDVWRWN